MPFIDYSRNLEHPLVGMGEWEYEDRLEVLNSQYMTVVFWCNFLHILQVANLRTWSVSMVLLNKKETIHWLLFACKNIYLHRK